MRGGALRRRRGGGGVARGGAFHVVPICRCASSSSPLSSALRTGPFGWAAIAYAAPLAWSEAIGLDGLYQPAPLAYRLALGPAVPFENPAANALAGVEVGLA